MKIFNMDNKGVSPVVGTILLIAITVVLAGTIGYFATQQSPGQAAPSVSLSVERQGNDYYLNHNGGDTLSATELDFTSTVGNQSSFSSLGPGDSIQLNTTGDLVLVHTPSESVLIRTEVG